MSEETIHYQIAAIQRAIISGKAKNKWAASNKIKSLKKALINESRILKWNDYLAK